MAKAITGVVFLIMLHLFIPTHAGAATTEYSCPQNDDRRPTPAVRIVKFRLYLHVIRSGDCQTEYEVARAPITSISPTAFGSVSVEDLPLTAGPDLANSQRLGSMQGTINSPDFERTFVSFNAVFIFTAGPYNGSYIIVQGRVGTGAEANNLSEAAVVGGAGAFRSAKGYAYRTVYSLYGASEDRVTEFDFTIQLRNDPSRGS